MPTGLFITATDTGVGKTRVACAVARDLVEQGVRVGVYKPVASGCRREGDRLVSDDAVALWDAAGRPGELERVCPQRFEAAIAPHLAARAEGRRVDPGLLREGFSYWSERSELVLVEGAGGLLSPVSDEDYAADIAYDLGLPLIVVTRNSLGTINQTLLTLVAAATFRDGLAIAGIVLNQTAADPDDESRATNRDELARHCVPPILGELGFQATRFLEPVDWRAIAAAGDLRSRP